MVINKSNLDPADLNEVLNITNLTGAANDQLHQLVTRLTQDGDDVGFLRDALINLTDAWEALDYFLNE
jgi:hypothetical protein